MDGPYDSFLLKFKYSEKTAKIWKKFPICLTLNFIYFDKATKISK